LIGDATEPARAWLPIVPDWAWPLLGLLAAAVLFAAIRGTAGQPLRRRVGIGALRTLALAPLMLALLGLSSVRLEERTSRGRLVVLLDGSASMSVLDEGESRAQQVQGYLSRQRTVVDDWHTEADVEFWWLGDEPRTLTSESLARLPEPDGLATDYLSAIEASVTDRRPQAVVLLGDGADRGSLERAFSRPGADLTPLLQDVSFPVHTVSFGGPVSGDLSLTIGDHAPFAFVRRPVEIPVTVRGDAGVGGEVTVTLRRDGQLHASRAVSFSGGEGTVLFSLTPDEIGYLSLEVSAPAPAGDPLPGNNTDSCTLRIIRDRTRVLQLSSHPSWDVRFLRRFLKTDPNVDLVSFFIMREANFLGAFRSSPLSLIEFPHANLFGEDLPGFDLVILQNYRFHSLPNIQSEIHGYMSNLARFVEGGGGLLFIGGDSSFSREEMVGPLGQLLPTAFGEGSMASGGPVTLSPTAAGLRHPVMQLARGDEANREAWGSLPSPGNHNLLGAAHEDGVVLARGEETGAPLVAVRQVGQGRVMSVATDDTWRWAMQEEGGVTDAHATFWRNSMRWLVGDEAQQRIEVRPHRENIQPGDSVTVDVRLLEEDFSGLPEAPFTLAVEPLAKTRSPETLAGKTDEEGHWSTTLSPRIPATYRLVATDDSGERAEARFTVRPSTEELEDPAGKPELLQALASATGGQSLGNGDDLDDLDLRLQPTQRHTRSVASTDWDRWGWLLLAGIPLGLEWLLRRRWGLA